MSAAGPITARCDEADRLIEADEALAGLQMRAGGAFPGTVAVPSLLALVRRSRLSGVALAELLTVQDDGQLVSFRAAVVPDDAGTHIAITQWRLAAEAWRDENGMGEALMRQLADAHVVLDAEQRIISGTVAAPDLADLGIALRKGFGRYWTDLVELRGNTHRQPLHWRLLDDALVGIAGSARLWRARLLPLQAGGFELFFVGETVLPAMPEPAVEPDEISHFKGLLGSNLAPALRQPLNRIVANAETIRTRLAGPIADQYVGYAGDIAEAGRHLLGLVEDLGDLETVEDSHFAPQTDPIDLADCARRAAGILGVRAQERDIAVEVPPLDVRTPAIGEFRRVLQILINLIGNAIRYTPGNTTVRVECGVDGGMSWLAVIDQGDGIAADKTDKVFEKFERLGRSGDDGSGLGLYISRKLARAMGGELAVFNDTGGGACFVLSLPTDVAGTVQASA